MTTIDVGSLITVTTEAEFIALGLELAVAVGLPVESWRVGDPTHTMLQQLSETLATRDVVSAAYAKSAFLSEAEGDWLTVTAKQVFGVERTEATYATAVVTVDNAGGGVYPLEIGAVTFEASVSKATYRSTEAVTIGAGETGVEIEVVADVAGSGGSAAVDEIDSLVTTLTGVNVVSSTAAVGLDEQASSALVTDCENTLGALSPNGPNDAYEYVATKASLTGVDDITRANAVGDSTAGLGSVYLAGASGVVAGASVVAAQAAIDIWATPLGFTPTAVSATASPLALTATVNGDDIPADFEATISTEFGVVLAAERIGDTITRSQLLSMVQVLLNGLGATNLSVVLSAPAADVVLLESEFATPGAVSVTEI
jgi:hypothetical protein